MGSPSATVLLTWTAIYAYVGLYYCMLYARRPTEREYLVFGLLVLSIALWTLGGVLEASAETVRDEVFGLQIRYFGGFAGAAYFTDFSVRISGRRAPRLVNATYLTCLIGIFFNALGLCVADAAHGGSSLVFGGYARTSSASLTNLGAIMTLSPLAGPIAGLVAIARGTRTHRDLRAFLLASAIATIASIYDTVSLATRLPQLGLVSHAALLPVVTMSYILLRRFDRSGDELAKRTDELRLSYGELRVVQEELVRKEQLAAVGELSAVIAHEVRNPLAIIKNAVSSLRRPSLGPEDRHVLLSILDEEVDRLNRLVRDLLAYARPVAPRNQPVDLREMVAEVVAVLLERRNPEETVELRLSGDALSEVHGDPELLRQVFQNVADNALQAMPHGGLLEVVAARDTQHVVRIAFRDTGIGMSDEDRRKALDPFFTTRATGTGLGLAIVDRIIKNHGGEVALASELGVGTEVIIRLPLAGAASAPPPQKGATSDRPPSPSTPLRGPRRLRLRLPTDPR